MIKFTIILVCWLSFIASGCIYVNNTRDQDRQDYIDQLEQQNQTLSIKLKCLQQESTAKQIEINRLESLQPKLLAKQIKIEQLKLKSKQSAQQVVRTRAKLRSHHSKAGIVVHLAEVKTELNNLAEKPMGQQQQQVVQKAGQLIEMSVSALNKNDLEAASSLSNKAQKLLVPLLALQTKKQNRLNVDFASPLIMTIKKECNVRKAPGMKSIVLFTMDAGAQIKALAFVRNWLHIETAGQRKGWIYYRLLTLDQ